MQRALHRLVQDILEESCADWSGRSLPQGRHAARPKEPGVGGGDNSISRLIEHSVFIVTEGNKTGKGPGVYPPRAKCAAVPECNTKHKARDIAVNH